jgi:hypothetical protein
VLKVEIRLCFRDEMPDIARMKKNNYEKLERVQELDFIELRRYKSSHHSSG